MARPTITDVAKLADVSPSAVSMYLNNRPGLGMETQVRIAESIDELGYVPRSNDSRRKSKGFIGLLVEKLPKLLTGDLFYADVATGIQKEAERFGYSLAISVIGESPKALPRLVAEDTVAGLLALGGGDITDELLQLIINRSMPLVTVDNQSNLQAVNSVVVDNFRGAYRATQHLIELGHRRIGIIQGPAKYKSLTERFHGYVNAQIDVGFAVDWQLVQQPLSSGYPNKGYREMKALLSLEEPPTAVFAVSDRTALGAIQALQEVGLQVPRDFSLVGFDDMPPNAYPPPALSTVTSERIAMGRIAMQRLHRVIKNPRYVPIQIVMPSQLVIRGSSAPPRKAN
ncbi:MAG: LacI family DNA-binding transcriptional regulator [Chloroflexi bacterium]|nr:LacI family DNA-binding transcriptional regulator [Chloroflexota bacterium]MCY4248277.1 LacI family DNA-binding transcriptional regulator [Chloroflexota bacterium]